MNLNNTFNQNRFEEYAVYLKNSGLSKTSLKRKLSSLASFQRFLLRKKLVSRVSLTNPSANENPPIFTTIKNIFPFKKKRNN